MSQNPLEQTLLEHIDTKRPGDILDRAPYPNPVPREIARRIAANAELIQGRKALTEQVLIVLADYRDHTWAYGTLKFEIVRIALANKLVDLVLGPETP